MHLRFSLVFGIMTVLAIPVLALNHAGLTSLIGVQSKCPWRHTWQLRAAQRQHQALGGCASEGGKVDCNGTITVDTPFTNRVVVSYYVTACDLLYSLVFLAFIAFLNDRLQASRRDMDARSISSTDYSVVVTGLPDVTEAEVRDVFSQRYDLSKDGVASTATRCVNGITAPCVRVKNVPQTSTSRHIVMMLALRVKQICKRGTSWPGAKSAAYVLLSA